MNREYEVEIDGEVFTVRRVKNKEDRLTDEELTKEQAELLAMAYLVAESMFEEEALHAIVDKAIERKTGARGLRAILEETMRDIMFEIPTNKAISKCIITKGTVMQTEAPKLIYDTVKETMAKVAVPVKKAKKTSKVKSVDSAS